MREDRAGGGKGSRALRRANRLLFSRRVCAILCRFLAKQSCKTGSSMIKCGSCKYYYGEFGEKLSFFMTRSPVPPSGGC